MGVVTLAGGLAFLESMTAEFAEVTSRTPCGDVVLIPTYPKISEEHRILSNKLDFFMVCFFDALKLQKNTIQ
ncbi:hypothetical protein [Chryseobacterium cucumeris]|uniref:hypothetical protein n=1 Tax=Chryseobacterium cucumeris TaxID=1813611 RepID=UPI00192D99D5|nr:hypothetical protein [Chryseobacterium cucumeris]QRA42982.1 hypothetical protein JNG87_20570 [Chryseobacterium cucumeris]